MVREQRNLAPFGWTWKVVMPLEVSDEGVITPLVEEPHSEVQWYDPLESPSLLRDWADVGRTELLESGCPNVLNPSDMPIKAREDIEDFCNRYGPPLPLENGVLPLLECRVAFARFAAIWEVWKRLSEVYWDGTGLPIEEGLDTFRVYEWGFACPQSH